MIFRYYAKYWEFFRGSLGRKDWNSGSVQDLQPSLDDILTVYIPTHIPSAHKDKPIVICICIGGDVKEEVRLSISQYGKSKKTDRLEIVEWDGDYLSSKIEKHFLQEDLLPKGMRPLLRKSLALLDEPQASFGYFYRLIQSLSSEEYKNESERLTAMRQINICLWILFAWSKDVNNLESSYLSSEICVLHAWELCKENFKKKTKAAKKMQLTFTGILQTYQSITIEYLSKVVMPYANTMHGLSYAVRSSEYIDTNLKLFDVIGRLSISGLWTYWNVSVLEKDNKNIQLYSEQIALFSKTLKQIIVNNPVLFSPIKDSQAIDIGIALLFLSFTDDNENDSINWLTEMLNRSLFSFESNGMYPCVYDDYYKLLDHPENRSDEYKKDATAASILYPTIGLWAALLKNNDLYEAIQRSFKEKLSHCNYQFWYVGDTTESQLYLNNDVHGAAFSHVPINLPADEFLKAVWDECDQSDCFKKLSCVESGLWPLLLIACRHYRLPIPIDFTLGYRDK